MFLMKVIQKIRFALVIENEIFYINGIASMLSLLIWDSPFKV